MPWKSNLWRCFALTFLNSFSTFWPMRLQSVQCRVFNVCCATLQIFVQPNHKVWLVTITHFQSRSSLPSVHPTLDLWLDVLLPNSRPISAVLLNQYVHWWMLGPTDYGWQKSTGTFAGCPFNIPFVNRGWAEEAGLGDAITISITGELSQGWGWRRVHIERCPISKKYFNSSIHLFTHTVNYYLTFYIIHSNHIITCI